LVIEADLTMYPQSSAYDLSQHLGQFVSTVSALTAFIPDPNQPINAQKQRYGPAIVQAAERLGGKLVQAVSFGIAMKNASDAELQSRMDALESAAKRTITSLSEKDAAATAALDAIRKAAGATGVGAQSKTFGEQATGHGGNAAKWLRATGVLTAVTALYAGFLAFPPSWMIPSDFYSYTSDWTHLAMPFAGRAIFGSLLLWSIAWSARQYRAHRHNEVVNRHRQTALQTFDAFVNAAEGDEDTKNAVLVQTTQAIFAGQATGYLPEEPEPSPHTTILEILRKGNKGD
jgi:hypothetical protein